MATLPKEQYPKPLVIGAVIAIVAIFIGTVALLYHQYAVETSTQSSLEDPEGDVEPTGEEYRGIIDVIYVKLEFSAEVFELTITVKDYVPEHLDYGEYAQWAARVILIDETEELLAAYEVWMEMNSTLKQGELVGYFREFGAEEAESCKVERNGNSLGILATLDGLQSAKEIHWSISTTFEKWSGSELMTAEFDYAPDEGFQRTILRK